MENKTVFIKVAPYALWDAIKALDSCNDHNFYLSLSVTKMDNDLFIGITEKYYKLTGPETCGQVDI